MNPHASNAASAPAGFPANTWRNVSITLAAIGAVGALLGAAIDFRQFSHSYLVAFMYFLSLGLGALFLVIVHHLFDSSWSVPIRRFVEHIAYLLPVMALLFIPILLNVLFSKGDRALYQWMVSDPHADHALYAKQPLFTLGGFLIVTFLCFGVWTLLSNRLRYWSIKQDETGAAACTYKLRFHAAWGVFAFAFSLTLGAIMWVKALQHQWFSTMYGVYYFAESVWFTLAVVYLMTAFLDKSGPLRVVVHRRQYHDIGVLMLAFTIFYAYIHFSQYFLIWNANIPEETFWYLQRERGSWFWVGIVLIFGHFVLPFLSLLRIDGKLKLGVMVPLCVWAFLMHFADISFNIVPVIHPEGFHVSWMTIASMLFIAGSLGFAWLKYFVAHAPYPRKDPRLKESIAPLGDVTDQLVAATFERGAK